MIEFGDSEHCSIDVLFSERGIGTRIDFLFLLIIFGSFIGCKHNMVRESLDNITISNIVNDVRIWFIQFDSEYFGMRGDIFRVLANRFDIQFVNRKEQDIVMRMVEEIRFNESLGRFLSCGLFESLDHFQDGFLSNRVKIHQL